MRKRSATKASKTSSSQKNKKPTLAFDTQEPQLDSETQLQDVVSVEYN